MAIVFDVNDLKNTFPKEFTNIDDIRLASSMVHPVFCNWIEEMKNKEGYWEDSDLFRYSKYYVAIDNNVIRISVSTIDISDDEDTTSLLITGVIASIYKGDLPEHIAIMIKKDLIETAKKMGFKRISVETYKAGHQYAYTNWYFFYSDYFKKYATDKDKRDIKQKW
jgi:hypothetical protein